MVSELQKAKIVQLRGLGYQHQEIAEILGLKRSQVAYHLHELKQLSKKKDPDSVYLDIMVSGLGPELIKLVGKLEKLGKLV